MTKNINDVREHLFAALEGLSNAEKPMDIDRAKAICEAAQVLINSAKVEVDYLRATGGQNSQFLYDAATNAGARPIGVQKHLLKG